MNASIANIITERLQRIVRLAPRLKAEGVGVIVWFQRELSGPLRGLHLVGHRNSGGSGRVDIMSTNGDRDATVALSREMLDLIENYALCTPNADLIAVVGNFLIHEIVNRAQGMGDGRHRGLRSLVPDILSLCDYEADASAVLVQTFLDCAEIDTNFLDEATRLQIWRFHRKNISSVIGQIGIFSLMSEGGLPISPEQEQRIPIALRRWERMAAWHFQHHRANTFLTSHPPADLQLLFPPRIFSQLVVAMANRQQLYMYVVRQILAIKSSLIVTIDPVGAG